MTDRMKAIITAVLLFFSTISFFAQGFVNHGAQINIEEDAFVYCGNLQLETNAKIDLNGLIELEGNWINNNPTNPFINIETDPNGLVRFVGNTETEISGTNTTTFENIHIAKENLSLENNNSVEGNLSLEGTLILNSHHILLLNPSPEALSYLSGYIISESAPAEGLGEIIWNIAESTGNYHIPFGSGNDTLDDIGIHLTIESPGNSDNGNFSFATYPTDADNLPFPSTISNLDPLNSQATVNRYWKAAPEYNTNPDIILSIKYDENSLAPNINESIQEEALQIAQYNENDEVWERFEQLTNNAGIVGETNIQGNQLFGWFTLNSPEIEIEFEIPNGITPNGDGYNDQWILSGCEQCKVWIYNRWGNLVYESDNYDNNWDGDDYPSGAYYYIIESASGQTYKGDLNILR